MRIGIVGSRSITDYDIISKNFFEYLSKNNLEISDIEICSGGATGVDSLAKKLSIDYNIPIQEYLPDWKRYGRSAGIIRNGIIVDNSDIILAFYDGESKGTLSTINNARKKNKDVIIYKSKKED